MAQDKARDLDDPWGPNSWADKKKWWDLEDVLGGGDSN